METRHRPTVDVIVERAHELELEFEHEDGAVTVRGRGERRWWGWRRDKRPQFRLTVPYRHDLDLKTSGGDITVDKLQGLVAARTSGGDVRVGEIDGPVNGKTSGGDIRIGKARGTVVAITSGGSIKADEILGTIEATTSGGSIRIRGAHGAVQAKTSGGSIEAEFVEQPATASALRTSGGGLTVYLPADIAIDVDARTSGGRVSTDFPVTVEGELPDKNRLRSAINGGGPRLALRTSGGSIRLRRRQL